MKVTRTSLATVLVSFLVLNAADALFKPAGRNLLRHLDHQENDRRRLHANARRRLQTITATSEADPNVLATNILSLTGGATITNPTLSGASACAGLFSGGANVDTLVPLLPDTGVILSSGNVASIQGPNNEDGYTTAFFTPGDPELDALIPGYSTNDCCALEFDFECPEGHSGTLDVTFSYVFMSDEYNEWVHSSYNDVFGFFLNGQNIALLPDGLGTPVSINNVNNIDNPLYYISNDCSDGAGGCPHNIEADGLTTTLTAVATTVPGTNHMKLAIADAGDSVLDSWVLLQAASFACTSDNCNESKGCHPRNADKRAICHRQGKAHNTLCLPAEAIAAHLAEHEDDTCGCCDVDEEKRRPSFCEGT